MMTADQQKALAILARQRILETLPESTPPQLPLEEPEDPTVWVLMEDFIIGTGGGPERVQRGQKYTDFAQVNRLRQSGADIRPFA